MSLKFKIKILNHLVEGRLYALTVEFYYETNLKVCGTQHQRDIELRKNFLKGNVEFVFGALCSTDNSNESHKSMIVI